MAQNDVLKRYIDTGLAFTAVTQARAEALVKDLVKAGEVQADQAREVDRRPRGAQPQEQRAARSRPCAARSRTQITGLGLVSKADLDKAEERIAVARGAATAPVRKAASGSKAAAKAAGQEGPAAKKATGTAKKATGAKKAPAKKAPAKKAPAKKAPPRRRPEPLARRRLDAELVRRGLAPQPRSRPRPTSRPGG